mgnify:CR=1 FL=1
MSDLKGVCVPICTPFKDNGASLDLKVFEATHPGRTVSLLG